MPDLPWSLAQRHALEVGPWAGCGHVAHYWHREILHACPSIDHYMLHSSPTVQNLPCAERKKSRSDTPTAAWTMNTSVSGLVLNAA